MELQLRDLLIIMRQVSSLKVDQFELTSACFSSFRLMKPLWSVSTLWNHWYASWLTPGGMLPAHVGNKRVAKGLFSKKEGEKKYKLILNEVSSLFHCLTVESALTLLGWNFHKRRLLLCLERPTATLRELQQFPACTRCSLHVNFPKHIPKSQKEWIGTVQLEVWSKSNRTSVAWLEEGSAHGSHTYANRLLHSSDFFYIYFLSTLSFLSCRFWRKITGSTGWGKSHLSQREIVLRQCAITWICGGEKSSVRKIMLRDEGRSGGRADCQKNKWGERDRWHFRPDLDGFSVCGEGWQHRLSGLA